MVRPNQDPRFNPKRLPTNGRDAAARRPATAVPLKPVGPVHTLQCVAIVYCRVARTKSADRRRTRSEKALQDVMMTRMRQIMLSITGFHYLPGKTPPESSHALMDQTRCVRSVGPSPRCLVHPSRMQRRHRRQARARLRGRSEPGGPGGAPARLRARRADGHCRHSQSR